MATKRRSADELAALADRHADDVLELEQAAARDVGALFTAVLQAIMREITRRWVTAAGSIEAAPEPATLRPLRTAVAPVLRRLDVDPRGPVRDLLRAALALGVSQALEVLGTRRPIRPPVASREIRAAIVAMPDAVDEAVDLAQQRLRHAETWPDMVGVIGALHTAQSRSEATARWAANAAVNEGVEHVADALGTDRVWVAERLDACLECLAYQGHVVKAGEWFPGGLTFRAAGKKRFPDDIPGPPRHPNCRCRVQPWLGEWADGAGVSYLDVLRREAQRAVLRGDAGESTTARLSAADKLLQAGTRLPVTVERRARRAIAAGEFRSRTGAR